MTAAAFTEQIASFALPESHFLDLGFEKEYAQLMANGYTFRVLGTNSNSPNEIINLITNYDMSNVESGGRSYGDVYEAVLGNVEA